MISTEFLLTSLVVVLIPGTGVVYTISTGLFQGWRASVAAAIGCTAGIIPHLTASVLGLSAILHVSALTFQAVKYAGVVYLLYLAWQMWRATGDITFNRPEQQHSALRIIARGIVLNLLNPKLSIFFLAFLPLFVSTGAASPLAQMLILSGIFMGMTLCVFILYGLMAGGASTYVIRSPMRVRWLQRAFAIIFAGLAARLSMSEQ